MSIYNPAKAVCRKPYQRTPPGVSVPNAYLYFSGGFFWFFEGDFWLAFSFVWVFFVFVVVV